MEQMYIYTQLGVALKNSGNYQEAINCFKAQLEIAIQIGDRETQFSAYGNIGNTYQRLEQYDNALEYYEKAREIIEDSADNLQKAHFMFNLGGLNVNSGKALESVQYF